MATYQVDTVNGLGYNDGVSAPLKTLNHAYALCAAGDTISLSADLTHRVRENFKDLIGITLKSADSGRYAYISGGTVVTPGSPVQLRILNQSLDEWSSVAASGAHNPFFWEASGTRNRSTVTVSGSGYSVLLGGSAYLQAALSLPYNIPITVSVSHKWFASNGRPNITIRANKSGATPANRYWNNVTLAWQDADPGTVNQPANGSVEWGVYSTTFTTNPGMSNGDRGVTYYVTVKNASSGALYVDSITATTPATNLWVNHSGDCWKLAGLLNSSFAYNVHYGQTLTPATEFSTIIQGTIASISECIDSPISCFVDYGTNETTIYVNFGGLNPNTLDIETSIGISYGGGTSGHCAAGHNNSVFDCICGLQGSAGIHAIANGIISNSVGCASYQGCLSTSNSQSVWNNCIATKNEENGFSSDGSTSKTSTKPTYNKCVAVDNGDDGFQSIFGASFIANLCVATKSGPGAKNSNVGFINEGSGTGMELRKCLAIGNYNAGFSADFTTGGVVSINDCISFGNVTSSNVGEKDITITGTPGSNITNTVVGTANQGVGPGLFPSGVNSNLVADPKFVSNADYHLRTDSPCLGTGTKIPGINKDIENNPLFPPYNIGPYGIEAGALGVAPVVNDGPPRNNITRLTGESAIINPTDTYQFEDTNAWRVVTGWTAGTANDFFDVNGVPITFTGQQLIDAGIGYQLYYGQKGVAGYSIEQDAKSHKKIVRVLRVNTYLDSILYDPDQDYKW